MNTLPDDVDEYLNALLHMGMQLADLQYDDVARRGMYIMVQRLEAHFGYDLDIDWEELINDAGDVVH